MELLLEILFLRSVKVDTPRLEEIPDKRPTKVRDVRVHADWHAIRRQLSVTIASVQRQSFCKISGGVLQLP